MILKERTNDGFMHGWMDGLDWTDGWMDGWMHFEFSLNRNCLPYSYRTYCAVLNAPSKYEYEYTYYAVVSSVIFGLFLMRTIIICFVSLMNGGKCAKTRSLLKRPSVRPSFLHTYARDAKTSAITVGTYGTRSTCTYYQQL